MLVAIQEDVLAMIGGFLHDEVDFIDGRVRVEVMRERVRKHQRVGKTCDIAKIPQPGILNNLGIVFHQRWH